MKRFLILFLCCSFYSLAQTSTTISFQNLTTVPEDISLLQNYEFGFLKYRIDLDSISKPSSGLFTNDVTHIDYLNEYEYSENITNSLQNYVLDASYIENMEDGGLSYSFRRMGKFRFKDDYIINYERNFLKRLLPPIPGEDFIYCPNFNY